VQSKKWALGYLRGRVKAYGKGNVTPTAVTAAARIARDGDVPAVDIAALLHAAGLGFDDTTHQVIVKPYLRALPGFV